MIGLIVALTIAFQSRPGVVPSSLIVGRAVCGRATWLLTDKPELVSLPHADPVRAQVTPVSAIVAGDKVWGLACLQDEALWTLASPGVLARIEPSGQLRNRTTLRVPWVALFGWESSLLAQQLPITVGAPALVQVRPGQLGQLSQATPWPGLRARSAATREREIARNLVACGLAFEQTMPCWFADAREMSWSNGSSARTVPVAELLTAAADREAPIRDVALVGPERYWLLESGPAQRGVVGTRLSLVANGRVVAATALTPGARTILAATGSTCVLVSIDGAIVEWRATP